MTTVGHAPELTAAERAQVDAFEAAAYAEDALRERVAVALCEDDENSHGCRPWSLASEELRDDYRRLADAALRVITEPVASR